MPERRFLGEQYVKSTLPGRLAAMLAGIRSHAPAAKIVVIDYPDFYDLSVPLCIGLSSADHQALDNGINELDGALQTAAKNNGDTFADVRSGFSGRELCDGSGWLNSVTLPIGNSYHPTAAGQKNGYLPAFTTAAAKAGQLRRQEAGGPRPGSRHWARERFTGRGRRRRGCSCPPPGRRSPG